MSYCEEIKRLLFKYQDLGKKKLEDGTVLIGKALHIAPEAWLHQIYPTLSDGDINALESSINRSIPNDYKQFLSRCSNGLNVFADVLSLDGLRKNMNRSSIEAAWQPYSILTANTKERLKNAPRNCFFLGGYSWDGSLLYLDEDDGKVYRTSRKIFKPLNMWNDFETMFICEIERISALHDEEGRRIDINKPTVPVCI